MPVVLRPKHHELWLAEDARLVEELLKVLVPYPADQMEGYPVSTLVNKPQNDMPDCIVPVGAL